MRLAGFTLVALLIAASVGLSQPPAVPGAPPPPAAPPVKAADPKLDGHLVERAKKMAGTVKLRTEITLKRTDAVFKKDTNFSGVVLCCDGKAVYAYNGVQKTITKIPLPQNQPGVDNLMLDFLAGMKAKDVKERFDINLFKTDENYIYLDIKPLRPNDQREFTHLRLALYGPGPNTAKFAYLPAQVYMLKPNGDSESWMFTKPQVDIQGVAPANFAFVPVKGWEVKEAPAAPIGGAPPKGPAAGPGAVRPGVPNQ